MKVSVEPVDANANASSHLPVIPGVSVDGPTRVEGKNGIGKTLFVHLLEMLAGHQPYASRPEVWRSLKTGLPELRVRVSGLRVGGDLEATVSPEAWPETPDPVSDWFGEARLGGKSIALDEIGGFFDVVRIGGNEDLRTVIQDELKSQHQAISRAAEPLSNRLREASLKTGPLIDMFGHSKSLDPAALELSVEDASSKLKAAEARMTELKARRKKFERAVKLRALLTASSGPNGDLARISELAEQLEELKGASSAQVEKVEALLSEMDTSGAIESDVAKAERKLQSRISKLRAFEVQILELDPSANDIKLPDVEEQLAVARDEVERIRRERTGADSSMRVRDLIQEILPPIETAVEEGVGESEIGLADKGPIRIVELGEGLRQTESDLSSKATSTAADQLDQELEDAMAQVAVLGRLVDLLKARDRQRELVEEAGVDLEAAKKKLDESSEASAKYEELVASREKLDAEIHAKTGELVAARIEAGLRGDQDPGDVQGDLDELLGELQIELPALDDQLADALGDEQEAAVDLASANSALILARRNASTASTALKRVERAIATGEEFEWARPAILPQASAAIDELSMVQFIDRVRHLDDRISRAQVTVDRVIEFAGLISKAGDVPANEITEALWAALGERLRARLDSESVRAALFEGNELERVDLREERVTWRDNGEAEVVRDFASFSTGEQAFAFTQARILSLGILQDDADRLLALDEFGAFIAADRAEALAEFLEKPEVASRATAVMVVLPQQANYDNQLSEVTGGLKKSYEERVAELKDHGYFTEPLRDPMGAIS